MKTTKQKLVENKLRQLVKEVLNEESYNPDQIRNNASGYVGSDFAKLADDDDLIQMVKLKDQYSKIKNQLLPIIKDINNLRKQYKLKPDQFYK